MRDVHKSDYLFQRKRGGNAAIWYLRRRDPVTREVTEVSSGMTDKAQARVHFAKEIADHEALIVARRQERAKRTLEVLATPKLEPGKLHTLPDGRTAMASADTIIYSDGTQERNRVLSLSPFGKGAVTLDEELEFQGRINAGTIDAGVIDLDAERPKLVRVKDNPDDALLEDYIRFGAITKKNGRGGKPLNSTREKQARKLWATFRQVVNKPLAECGYDDGVKLVAHIEAEHQEKYGVPIKAATVRRTLVPLIALVTRALVLKKLTGTNPFLHVGSSNGAASDVVDEFSDSDVALIRKNLHKLSKEDQLLLRVACATGMDRGELFGIRSEATEDGIRYCTIAKGKTDQRVRRVPFPAALLKCKDFPKKISKPLFTGRPDTTGKRLTEFLGNIGVVMDKGIGEDGAHHILHALHSFRHRARTKLRAAYPGGDELAYAIGGWSDGKKKNAAWTYGKFPLATLKEAIDKIGGL